MSIPDKIRKLIETFDYNLEMYKKGLYNETQVRLEFINPFFEELGWDITNKQGYAEAYKDVIHEDAIKIGGITKAPDYCFRIGGVRKFFLEAKKPAVNIKEDIHPAYQLRRYGWSAKLPLSILTDFEEFAVYDCRVKPAKTDKVSHSRILYMRYTDYIERWDEIVNIFSPKAILKGSFDKYVELKKTKKGTAEVDKAFLAEIERWRELLARNIALRNPDLTQRELNFAVQQTIDRIVFLRICEDRGIENYGRLMALQNGNNVYRRLFQLFRKADEKYNSGLFHFKKEKSRETFDSLTPNLIVDDNILKDIFKNLYYPESPYEFSVLPADILGQVYEQFLGKIIRLTSKHRAIIEEKPEVRKAGGVYYTPTYIVNYIVKNTVGKLLESKKPGPRGSVSNLRILDPACGSGSFLIGAYQFLLDWHRDQYVNDDPEKWAKGKTPRLYRTYKEEWRLTTDERKRILLNNIYGVDIDPQAVEVTKLSLLLKVLEGENEQSIGKQMALFQERVLPDLANNIKCGNSLIGPDFYENQQMSLLDEEEMYRVNSFDWNVEFIEIMKSGGFDAVIGNPPYGMVEEESDKDYFLRQYETTEGRFDRYELFIEQGINLTKSKGMMSYIIPSPLLSNLYTRKLREYILENCTLNQLVNFEFDVFDDPTIHTCIIILTNIKSKRNMVLVKKGVNEIAGLDLGFDYAIEQLKLGNNPNRTFDIYFDPSVQKILDKINQIGVPLGEVCYIRQCIKTGDDKTYVISSLKPLKEPWKPTLKGRSIGRYATLEKDIYLKYGDWLARNWKNKSFYETEKIVVRETGNRIISTLDTENRYLLSSLYSVYPKEDDQSWNLKYLLGFINSNLATFFIKLIAFNLTKGAFTKVRTNQLARLPVKEIVSPKDKELESKIIQNVNRMLKLQERLQTTKLETQLQQIQRTIDYTETKIDELVYELYGLSEEEIETIESC